MLSKYLTFFSALLLQTITVSAQGQLSFSKDTHDFGVVTEGTQATYDFEFTNNGSAPVIISNVSASCGCTTPFWTKEPVLPGKKGKVTASYNSMGRPGVFHKTVTVVSNAEQATRVLTIKGTVEPKAVVVDAKKLEQSPKLQLNKVTHHFGKVEKGQVASHLFTVQNTGKSDLAIQTIQSACNCVAFKTSQASIRPGEKATLELRYNPFGVGQQNEVISLYSNDLHTPVTKVTLQANVVESLASQNMLREQKTAVPFK